MTFPPLPVVAIVVGLLDRDRRDAYVYTTVWSALLPVGTGTEFRDDLGLVTISRGGFHFESTTLGE